jgi:hypothetical protein
LFQSYYAEIEFDFLHPFSDSATSNMLIYVTTNDLAGEAYHLNTSPIREKIFNTSKSWEHHVERIKAGTPIKPGSVVILSTTINQKKFMERISPSKLLVLSRNGYNPANCHSNLKNLPTFAP